MATFLGHYRKWTFTKLITVNSFASINLAMWGKSWSAGTISVKAIEQYAHVFMKGQCTTIQIEAIDTTVTVLSFMWYIMLSIGIYGVNRLQWVFRISFERKKIRSMGPQGSIFGICLWIVLLTLPALFRRSRKIVKPLRKESWTAPILLHVTRAFCKWFETEGLNPGVNISTEILSRILQRMSTPVNTLYMFVFKLRNSAKN